MISPPPPDRPLVAIRRLAAPVIALIAVAAAAMAAPSARAQDAPPAPSPYHHDAVYNHAAVAADHVVASQAGAEMLRKGGNAVDAAVATSFTLSVVRPMSCGIGGGGFMVIYTPGSGEQPGVAIALNYRETSVVDCDYYVNLDDPAASRFGARASGVPGTVAGLLYALEHYGTLDRATVLAPAIIAAEDGFPVDASHVGAASELGRRREASPGRPGVRESSEYLWKHLCLDGAVKAGDTVRNPDQARALRLIAEHGADAFYRGPIADAIAGIMAEHGGPITREDLAAYQPRVMKPLVGEFRGNQIISMPPPSSGGIAMQQVFGLMERRLDELSDLSPTSPQYVHLLAEALKHAFADRAEWLADSAFVEVPVERLLSDAYLDELAARISMEGTLDPYDYGSVTPALAPATDDGGTSHLSVIDERGMAVACTETINLTFGSMVVVPGFGFALNNEMDDFTTIPGKPNAFGLMQSDRNLPQRGKRPLSSMSPTIVVKDGAVRLVAGAAGGPRIITATTQCLLNVLLFDMHPGEAVAAARLHHQWMPMRLDFEAEWTNAATISAMRALGHETGSIDGVGVAQVIGVTTRGVHAASDPRRGGQPAGH